ncbi:MAG: hypothetical protein U0871_03570 [Gemmataceae bacterium]
MPTRLTVAALLGVALLAGPAAAQRPKVKIEDARVGLPGGGIGGERDVTGKPLYLVKRNTWAPIYLTLELLGEYDGGVMLQVEAADADDLKTTLVVPLLPTLKGVPPGTKIASNEFGYLPYTRIGDRTGDLTLTVLSDGADGRVRELSEPYRFQSRDRYVQFRDVSTYVVMGLGSRLPGFDLPRDTAKAVANQPQPSGLRNGRVQTAAVTNVRDLPDQWFGYNAADLVVLTTGSAPPEFLDELFDPQKSGPLKPRRDALLEWVRRGGKLVVSVGSNASKLSQFELFRDLLPATLKADQPTRAVPELTLAWKSADGSPQSGTLRPRTDTFPVANLSVPPGKPGRVLLPQPGATGSLEPGQMPAVVQAPFGLGRITVVGFDVDQSPFVDAAWKDSFWDWVVREAGSAKSAQASDQPNNYVNYGGIDTGDEVAGALRTHVDTVEGVPVISFGWVALFIVLYTLLIGPVEYLFLKKVVGRLELTWITFPLIVLSVSAAAYFTAYAIKGNDLKINKVDVVDVDLAGGRVYGRTWFSLFSPRIDSYTLAVEPKPGWGAAGPDVPPLVDWMSGGRPGSGAGGLVSRGYRYHTGMSNRGLVIADGLERVPVQVWSTKAFDARWAAPVDKAAPVVAADLTHPPADPKLISGSLTVNLPVKSVADATLLYAGKAYKLPALTPGQRIDVPPTGPSVDGLPADGDWFRRNGSLDLSYLSRVATYNNQPTVSSDLPLWGTLFHDRLIQQAGVKQPQNASLRDLDQSWRLTEENRDEAILVARVATASGPAEAVLADPDGPSPTLLWLRGRPGEQAREPVPGVLKQETYLRVFIPIKPAGRK